MDQLALQSTWKTVGNKGGVVLTGLLLEGATFNGTDLIPCTSTSENINVAPDGHIVWADTVIDKRCADKSTVCFSL